MRTYFASYEDCVTAWLRQEQEHGKVRQNRMFFTGRTLYSYGHHFVIAALYPAFVLLNSDTYSNTTSHQQHIANYKTRNRHRQQIFLPADWWELHPYDLRKKNHERNEPLMLKAVRARRYGQMHLDQAAYNQQQVENYITQLEREQHVG